MGMKMEAGSADEFGGGQEKSVKEDVLCISYMALL